jgi:alginate O-acetyltransferase complex protein AlgI
MLFNSFVFIIFHILCVGLFWSTKNLLIRNLILLAGSLLFYSWHYWPAIIILLTLMIINYFFSIQIEKKKNQHMISLAVIVNLSTLVWFKYSNFLAENLATLINKVGFNLTIPEMSYWLPLGISFYTFQIMGYLIDIHRGDIAAEKSFIRFAVFKCFYAQLIAGPIVRAKELLPQLNTVSKFDPKKFHLGLYYFMAGLCIKIVVADTVAQFVDFGFENPSQLNALNSWMTLYGFAIQILSDFWGYSTVAIGIALMYGISLPVNFNNPYISVSIREFWRRWHITLSFWLRDYLYISLGGNKKKHLRNLFLTMTLGGLWHGASWNFIFWGMGHGLWLILERLTPSIKIDNRFIKLCKHILLFHGVCLLWVFFRAKDLVIAKSYFLSLIGSYESTIKVSETLIMQLLIFVAFNLFLGKSMRDESFLNWSLKKQLLICITLLILILAYANAKLDFIYFVF